MLYKQGKYPLRLLLREKNHNFLAIFEPYWLVFLQVRLVLFLFYGSLIVRAKHFDLPTIEAILESWLRDLSAKIHGFY